MKDWFIARSDKKYGPYSVEEMIQLRQYGKAFETDLIWKKGLRNWKTLIQVEEFSTLAMSNLSLQSDTSSLLNRRKWPRVKKDFSVYIHNGITVWKAKTVILSQGGTLIEIATPSLQPGDSIHINFEGIQNQIESFSCLGEIAGKRFNNERLRFNTLIQYSLRFTKKDECAEKLLEVLIQKILIENTKQLKGVKDVTAVG